MLPRRTFVYNALWGIDPPSVRRRWRAGFYFWLPLALMFAIWAGLAEFVPKAGSHSEQVFFELCFSLMITAFGVHCIRLISTDELRRFRTNWTDLRLSGMVPRDYLWSFARLRFSSGILVSILATIPFVTICLANPGWLHQREFWAMAPSLLIDPVFLLTGGILIDVASWTTPGRFFSRMIALIVMILIGPICIMVLIAFALDQLHIRTADKDMVVGIAGWLFLPAIFLRIWFIRRTWSRAVERMEGDVEAPFL